MKADYDSSLARIAGNIASCLVIGRGLNMDDPSTRQVVAQVAVSLAREIVAEVKRMELQPVSESSR